jgi:hypothetical protein
MTWETPARVPIEDAFATNNCAPASPRLARIHIVVTAFPDLVLWLPRLPGFR